MNERNFCERCGKRLGGAGHIHTCSLPEPVAETIALMRQMVEALDKAMDTTYSDKLQSDWIPLASAGRDWLEVHK